MADIENEFIFRGVKDFVQGDGQFDRSEIRS